MSDEWTFGPDETHRHMVDEIAGLQAIVNETRALYPPRGHVALPPLSRWQRTRRRWSGRVRGARTALALRIAPWMENWS